MQDGGRQMGDLYPGHLKTRDMYIMILLASAILKFLLPFILRKVHLYLKDSMTKIIWAKPLDVLVTDAEQPSGIYQGRETYLSPDWQRPLLISGWIGDTKMHHFLAPYIHESHQGVPASPVGSEVAEKGSSGVISIPIDLEWLCG